MRGPKRDPRLKILETKGFVCSGCKQTHHGLFHLVASAPIAWTERYGDFFGFVGTEESGLNEDFCMLSRERYFVRGILEIPVEGVPKGGFAYSVWAEVPYNVWQVYGKNFYSNDQDKLGTAIGSLANSVNGFPDAVGTTLLLHFRANRLRPKFEMPFGFSHTGNAQHHGISFDRMLELYAEAGHKFEI